MDAFLSMYDSFIKFPKNIVENQHILYKTATDLISKTNKFKTEEEILTKLIILYPNDSLLYYRMAKMYKPLSVERAIMWHKIAQTINPYFFENIIDLFQIFFEMGNFEHMQTLNHNNIFESLIEQKNVQFIGMLVRSKFSLAQYENCIKHMLILIQCSSQKKCITYEEKMEKYNNYHDIGYMSSHLGDIENATKYILKAIDLADKFEIPISNRLFSLQTYLYLQDFLYNDKKKVYQKFLEVNSFLPDKSLFTFGVRNHNKKIKIGYISSDFNPHSVANFILPILKNHDRNKFEIHLFSNKNYNCPLFTDLKLPVHIIENIDAISSAKMINNLHIDILFDLNGNTSNGRLDVFAHHPAPIQISYLGYANTTGLKSIQYRLTDFVADHPDSTQEFSEQLIHMPGCFLLFDPIHNFIVNSKTTTNNQIVLGSLHKEAKLNDHVFAVWKKILDKCQNTVLFIKIESFDNVVERTEYYVKKLNVNRNRIIVSPQLMDDAYEKVYSKFDILLDSFPYSGTTITCNCLFNSIPVVTLYNTNCHAHNVSSSILINSGLSELVAYTQDEYIDIVTDLVQKPDKLNFYKQNIRTYFRKSMEPKLFMKKYEDVLTKIYNNDISSFIVPVKTDDTCDTSDTHENITISFSDEPLDKHSDETPKKNKLDKSVYIYGSLRNCSSFLDDVFLNIDKIVKLFKNYKIIISYDNLNDNSLDVLLEKKRKYNMELIHVSDNEDIVHRDMRTQRISNARNECLKYIRNENNADYQYMISMDMDNICSGKLDIDALDYHLKNDSQWDALSFNNKPYYFDVWALSIEPYLLSCWHFPNGTDTVDKTRSHITNRLGSMKKYDLLECKSAFNGFAIYKKIKFIDCNYNWRIKNIPNYVSKAELEKNEKAFGKLFTIEKSYQEHINAATDCEHRQFHMEAIRKHGARIRISPICLFS